MTKPDGVAPESNDDVSPLWGTWEELLLAFAVNRHGTAAWDSIASELQKRTSDPNLCLTALNCRSKYLDLKRRFVVNNGDLEDGHDDKSNVEESVPLLEELRKLRVAELRREVQRYDLNIESLELKMKTMEEERERGMGVDKSEADLENKAEEKRDRVLEAVTAAGMETATAAELDKDQLSVNESNSTDPGAEKFITGDGGSEPAGAAGVEMWNASIGQTREEPVELKSEPDQKTVREDSCNGSSNSIEQPNRKAKKAEPVAVLTESEAESDGRGADATKGNSDVQSSAGRSRKEEASDKVRRGNTSGDEREHEDESGGVKELAAESQPLVEFLQAIRGAKHGSVFERRLRSQETSKYHKLILQHMDLQTVETRLKQGWYSASATNFFRDLLLLVNNALVFFAHNSAEAMAAAEIRSLISKEISHKSHSSSVKHISLQSLSLPAEASPSPSPCPSPSPSLMLKPRISGSLIICRKRSSIAAKATPSSDKKKEPNALLPQDKDTKRQQPSGGDGDEPKITKKRTRERFPAASANTKKNGKNQGNNTGKQCSPDDSGKQQQGKGQQAAVKGDSKKSQSTSDSKKRGAANFLNRMKQGSSSNNNSVLLDALKNTPLTTSESTAGKGGSDQKKSENAKRGEKKEAAATRKQTKEKEKKEKSSPGKKNVGRPPKRVAGPSPALGKRSRDRGEPEAAALKQPKKRSRKL